MRGSGLTPSLNQSGESCTPGLDHQNRIHPRAPVTDRISMAIRPRTDVGPDPRKPANTASPNTYSRSPTSAQHRLHHVYHQMNARGKPHGVVTVVAVARELACFLWAAATAP